MQSVFIVAIVVTVASCAILAYGFVRDLSNSHSSHLTNIQRDLAANVEDTPTVERAGDAKFYSRLTIDNDFIDPTHSCDFCNKIEYTPSQEKKAGIAYRIDGLDLKSYHRIVFFARGEQGGEIVSFVALGRISSGLNSNNVDSFPYQDFAITTKNVTLDDFWKRYEISLQQSQLENVTHPFGFVITGLEPGVKEIFYLKGVTFDRNAAKHPIPLVTTSISNIQPIKKD
jgi:hypothetical protein